MRCTISDDRSVVRATVYPRRSLWITLGTPFCSMMTALRLMGTATSPRHALWLPCLGSFLGLLYLWIFLGNLFERQEVDFHTSSITSTFNLCGLRRVRTYPVNNIRQIVYAGFIEHGEPSLGLVMRDREAPVLVLTGLENSEADTLLSTISQSVPVLGSKIKF